MDVTVDQRLPEVDSDMEDAVEVGLQTRKARHQYSGGVVAGVTKVDNGDGQPSENSTYLDINGGAVEDLDIHKIQNAIHNNDANRLKETAIANREEIRERSDEEIEEEIMEEEIVELEFEKAISKLHTHTMHCPKCDSQITKVILRRKIITRKPVIVEKPHKPLDLLGCFSCFSLFTSSDNGSFSPFPIFGKKPASTDRRPDENEDGNCFSIFRVFRKEEDSKQPKPTKIDQDFEQPKPGIINQHLKQPKPGKFDNDPEDITNEKGENYESYVGGTSHSKDQVPLTHGQTFTDPKTPGKDETRLDIPTETPSVIQGQTQRVGRQDSMSFEILKSIVYGGLMEVIASLSIVASAAAGDATTLNIIALALANLVGGVLVIGHNLWDLRDDCYKYSNQQTNDQESNNKYKELLGSIEHFPLHMFFAILSFLVFGIIPPVAYGYSFHETNDKDFTIMVVAIASFVCVGLLAIFKAYIDRCSGFSGYVKTIMYYLTTAVAVSGVSYAVGNLVTRLIEELGLFETSSGVATVVLPEVRVTNPSFAYY